VIIDFRVTVPAAERRRDEAPPQAAGGGRGYMSNYGRVYQGQRGGARSGDDLITAMDAAAVDLAVLQAEWASGDVTALNDGALRLGAAHPKRLIPYVTVNPAEYGDMVEVVKAGLDRGARGVNLQPFSYRLHCNDKRFYPLYAKCQELGLPVTVHTSINFSNDRSIDFGRPLYLCEVACDFPELKLVANHGGWPWVTEMVAVAWKHPNVYIEIGAVSPKYIGTPGSGWEPLMLYGNRSLLEDRILFATDSMLPFERVIAELRELPLKPDVTAKWLGLNAARLLGIGEG
jgi:predicted TIM-barrel fold metal-dependent hydrolase